MSDAGFEDGAGDDMLTFYSMILYSTFDYYSFICV